MNSLQEPVFYNLYPCILQHVPVDNLIHVARSCKRLNKAVNDLTTSYWIQQIELDAKIFEEKGFPPHGVVKWLNMVQDRHLAKITYIAFRLLCYFNSKKILPSDYSVHYSMFPAPVLCARLLNPDLSSFQIHLNKIWEAIPDSDRQIFFEMIAQISLSSTLEQFSSTNAKCYADFVNRGLDELLDKKSIKTGIFVPQLLLQFVEINALSAIDKLLMLKNKPLSQNGLDILLHQASTGYANITILQRIIDAGAKPANNPTLLHRVVTSRTPDELQDILPLLIHSGALVTTLNENERTPLGQFLSVTKYFDGADFVIKILGKHGDLNTVKKWFNEIMMYAHSYKTFQMLQELGAYQTPALPLVQLQQYNCKRDLSLFRALLTAGEDPKMIAEGKSALERHIPRCKDGEEIFSLLTLFDEFKADFTINNNLLHVICKLNISNRGKSVKFLLDKGLKATEEHDNKRPIHHVVSKYNPDTCDDVIEILLNAGETLSNISDVYLRLLLACQLGKIDEIKNWTGFSPVMTPLKINNHYCTPIVAAIKKGHVNIVEFLSQKEGQYCLYFDYYAPSPLHTAIMLKDASIRRKMVLFIVNELRNSPTEVLPYLHNLIGMKDFKLFKEIVDALSADSQKQYLSKYANEIASEAINISRDGNLEILEEIIKILPNEVWANQAPLFTLSGEQHAETILNVLYKRHPDWLYHKNAIEKMNLWAFICVKISSNDKLQSHYLNLFHLVNQWISEKPEDEIKNFYGQGLVRLFNIVNCNKYCLFDLTVENRRKIFAILFKREVIKITEDTRINILRQIYEVFFKACPTMENWKEMKEVLLPLQLNFGERNNHYVKTPLHGIEVTSEQIVHSLEKLKDPTELLLMFRDMIRFAYANKVKEGIFPDAMESSPLHKASLIKDSSILTDIGKERGEQISFALVDELINCGHPVDVQDSSGNTPLHHAVKEQNVPAALRLLKANAKYDIKNHFGRTALVLAKDTKNLVLICAMSKYHILIH